MNLRTTEDCDLNAAPLTKLGDPCLRSLIGCAYIMRTEIDGRFTNRINPQMVGGGRQLSWMEVMELPEPRGRARSRGERVCRSVVVNR